MYEQLIQCHWMLPFAMSMCDLKEFTLTVTNAQNKPIKLSTQIPPLSYLLWLGPGLFFQLMNQNEWTHFHLVSVSILKSTNRVKWEQGHVMYKFTYSDQLSFRLLEGHVKYSIIYKTIQLNHQFFEVGLNCFLILNKVLIRFAFICVD